MVELPGIATPSVGVAESLGVKTDVPLPELVNLCAIDTELFCHTFLPKAFRQTSPPFHKDIYNALDTPDYRHLAVECFRGSAKTTILRGFGLKRICYGISRTIMFVSASQAHASRSLRWVKGQIQYNKLVREVFEVEKGEKWSDEELQIYHKKLDITVTIIAAGITGQTRGVNVDDHRPDLIIVDDPDDEESTATPDQRKKTSDRFFGAIDKSLTPESENPEAKLVLLQTSLNKEDLINQCQADSTFASFNFGCFGEDGESAWPERWTTKLLRDDKQAHIARGQLLLWLREMECVVGDEETAAFNNIKLMDYDVLPEGMLTIMGIDPAPPPSPRQIQAGLKHKDSEVLSMWGYFNGGVYLLEDSGTKEVDPQHTENEFFRLCIKYKPLKVIVEGVAYQRTLKFQLERAMRDKKTYFVVEAKTDKRKKYHRIAQAYSGVGALGLLFVKITSVFFREQFAVFPNGKFDDYLDAGAMAVEELLTIGPTMAPLTEGTPEAQEIDEMHEHAMNRGAP